MKKKRKKKVHNYKEMKIKTFLILICIHFENDVENELKVDKNSELINYEKLLQKILFKTKYLHNR